MAARESVRSHRLERIDMLKIDIHLRSGVIGLIMKVREAGRSSPITSAIVAELSMTESQSKTSTKQK